MGWFLMFFAGIDIFNFSVGFEVITCSGQRRNETHNEVETFKLMLYKPTISVIRNSLTVFVH